MSLAKKFQRMETVILAVWSIAVATADVARAQRSDPYTDARWQLVDREIASEGVTNLKVLDAMRSVPRHLFVRAELRPYAYYDQALDIGHKQTISPPFVVAYMTEVIDPQPTDRVLRFLDAAGLLRQG